MKHPANVLLVLSFMESKILTFYILKPMLIIFIRGDFENKIKLRFRCNLLKP